MRNCSTMVASTEPSTTLLVMTLSTVSAEIRVRVNTFCLTKILLCSMLDAVVKLLRVGLIESKRNDLTIAGVTGEKLLIAVVVEVEVAFATVFVFVVVFVFGAVPVVVVFLVLGTDMLLRIVAGSVLVDVFFFPLRCLM